MDKTAVAGRTYRTKWSSITQPGTNASNTQRVTASTPPPPPPVAPTSATVTAATRNNNNDRLTLTWVNPAGNNQTGFTIQYSINSAFPANNTTTATAGANATTWTSGNVARHTPFYVRIQATNAGGASAPLNATPFPITTP